jgi:hypothetical protein
VLNVLTVVRFDATKDTAVAVSVDRLKQRSVYKYSDSDTSPYLRALLRYNSASDTSSSGLATADPESILLAHHWLTSGTVDLNKLSENGLEAGNPDRTSATFRRLGKAWVLGAGLRSKAFCNAVMGKMFNIEAGLLEDQIDSGAIQSILQIAPKESMLEELVHAIDQDRRRSTEAHQSEESGRGPVKGTKSSTRSLRRAKYVKCKEHYYV